MSLKAIDIVFIVVVLILGLNGFRKGFFSQLFSIIGVVLGLFLAYFFSDDLSLVLEGIIGKNKWLNMISFAAIFIGIVIVCGILNKIFKSTLETLGAQGMDRIFGFFFGVVQGWILCIAFTALLIFQPFFDPEKMIKESVIASKIADFLPKIEKIMPEQDEIIKNV